MFQSINRNKALDQRLLNDVGRYFNSNFCSCFPRLNGVEQDDGAESYRYIIGDKRIIKGGKKINGWRRIDTRWNKRTFTIS